MSTKPPSLRDTDGPLTDSLRSGTAKALSQLFKTLERVVATLAPFEQLLSARAGVIEQTTTQPLSCTANAPSGQTSN